MIFRSGSKNSGGYQIKKHFDNRFFFLFMVLFVCIGCVQREKLWLMSLDSRDRPITGCLKTNSDGLSAVIISNKCQKSVVESILLCSEGRSLQIFNNSKDCNSYYELTKENNGAYFLKDDPVEKLLSGARR